MPGTSELIRAVVRLRLVSLGDGTARPRRNSRLTLAIESYLAEASRRRVAVPCRVRFISDDNLPNGRA